MFSKTKKAAGILLAATMIATAFAGCGGNTEKTSSTGGEKPTDAATAPAVKGVTVEDMMANYENYLGDEGTSSEVKLTVWAPSEAIKTFQKQCNDFIAACSNRKISIEVKAQSESDSAATLMNDPDTAADLFGFASDNASKLYPRGYVAEVNPAFAAAIKETNMPGAVDVATNDDGKLVSFPETGDNGYFIYYNKSKISEEQIKSLEGIMEACNEADAKFIMSIGNGYYGSVIPLTAGGTYELDADGNQVLNYNKDEVVKVAKAFGDLLANDPHFSSDDTDKVLSSQLRSGKAIAGVSGTWKKAAIKAALGDNFACAKLPTIKVDGEDRDIISMYGYKLIGVNSNSKYPLTAQALAYYLTGEKAQTERATELGWGPSIQKLVDSDLVTGDVCLTAVYAQQKHSVPQIGLAGSFWDPTGSFGGYVVDKSSDLSVEGISKAYDAMYTSATAH
ncbi:MAG: extracellular solute-binding protein [Acutalibacteraceae bacterium]|nr:extracellular solute-binding protein [Acutalibacteraceae bacterium]